MGRNSYKRKWIRWHKSYEKRATKELRKVFAAYGKSIDLTDVTMDQLDNYLKKTLDIQLLYEAYAEIYTKIGVVHRKRVLEGLGIYKKDFPIHADYSGFKKDVIKYLEKFGGERIVSVHESYIGAIKKMIIKEVAKEWTLYDTAESLIKIIMDAWKNRPPWRKKSFYRWQSERIARTETTAAANHAALQAADDTGFVMVKEWISVGRGLDGRTREHEKGDDFDHVDMDAVTVPRYGKFEMMSADGVKEELDFPGDPRGSAANVINCRCTVALRPKRDRAGNLIPTF